CYAQSKHGARHFRTNVVRVETQEQFYEVVEKYFPRELDPKEIKLKSSEFESLSEGFEARNE
ncbi:MAG TPA: hypothetical protein VM260_26510, partial [Pirellula sp.]|nr:hypothetical protein [Pirellula sp.]